ILGATATLDFRIVEKTPVEAQKAADTGRIPPGTKLYYDRDGQPYLLSNRVIVSGKYINGASAGREQDSGQPAVFVNLNGQGGDMMSRGTKGNVGRLMAVVFIEDKQVTRTDADGKTVDELVTVEEVINSARILSQLGRRFQVTGLDPAEANKLALLLRAGSLAAPMRIVEERTVGPSLGAENIEKGFTSVVVGLLLVLIFMAIYYKVFGLIANVALLANIVIIVAVLGIIGATLTLPGIAGIVLTVGMAVDANVLIFERIREELRAGNSVQASIFSGYEKAFSTIADANVTTLIAAVILYAVGTGPIKGFAVTLSIGIATSMFTAIVGTRAIVNLAYGGRKLKSIAI
ncbi:MAG: protein translocase subunit SecD, partial [Gammaproteobacteria bacterium]